MEIMANMWRLLGKVLSLLFLAGMICLPWPLQAETSAPIPGRPALYEFGAGYCLSCKEMEKIMGELKGKYGQQLEVRLVYADKERDLFKQYKIMLIPTQVFLDASGKEVDRHIGALTRAEVLKKLRDLKFIKD
jgi:thioredoxin 1